VFASAGADFAIGSYIMTVVHRFANVDVEAAIAWERASPDRAASLHREIKAIYGGSWDYWWLRTPIDGVVWCNCPHIPDLNGLRVEDQTYVEYEARRRIQQALAFARRNLPGFERAALVDTAPQLGTRQTRLLRGEYILTKQDVLGRRWFADRIGRGRDYYYPYRVMLPREVEGLIVAGRCFSATSEAQRMSREIPPMFALGQAAGVAAALAWAPSTCRGGSTAGARPRPATATPPTTSAAVTTAATSHAPTRLPIAHHPASRRSFGPQSLDAATTPAVPAGSATVPPIR
jgi:hypothetical protein